MTVVSTSGQGTPRDQLGRTAAGVLVESGNSTLYTTGTAPVSQSVYGTLLGLRGGDIVTGIALRNNTAAAGSLPTTARFGIADSTGKILALSGNDTALALWPTGANPHALAAPYTVLADGGYFACFVVNGVWGTTPPTPIRQTGSGLIAGALGSAAPEAFVWTGQTDLPIVGNSMTITTAATLGYYIAFY